MLLDHFDVRPLFDRGVVILSLDTEQIWGYLDIMDERQFHNKYPDALGAHDKILAYLTAAGVTATWFVVGGMTLRGTEGARDRRLAGLPADWTFKIPRGAENSMPLWYRHSFVERLRASSPQQEIGLHGGLTHFIWTDARATRDVVKRELAEGVKALEQVQVRPRSFSYGREQEAFHELLPPHGIRAYRGRAPVLASRLGQTLPGTVLRLVNEMRRTIPPPVWPQETLPGLWNIPSSVFLYPIGAMRARIVALRSRVERFGRGLEAAIRHRGIFHFSLHPENLAESPQGFPLFAEILELLVRARDRGDVEVLTMSEVAARMENGRERLCSNPVIETPFGPFVGAGAERTEHDADPVPNTRWSN
jgi:peptidoglycan/xylan/chitin deacetylase (PgdA/CDA1 family)